LRIVVIYENGALETIALAGGWRVIEGPVLNRLQDESGLEHFFKHDGSYAGWGADGELHLEAPPDNIADRMRQKRGG
jgi:hypothetical protein